MKQFFFLLFSVLVSVLLFAQKNKKISVEISYGINGNFFVRSYDEIAGPPNKTIFYKKNFIGTIGGVEIKCKLNQKSRLAFGYAKSINSREIGYKGTINGVSIGITDFTIKHTNKFFQLYYERDLNKNKSDLKYNVGILYLRMNQQEVEISNFVNSVVIEERNYKTNKLEEGGVFVGFHYSHKIDTKFELGLKSRLYYLISTNSFEAITLTPTLTYHL